MVKRGSSVTGDLFSGDNAFLQNLVKEAERLSANKKGPTALQMLYSWYGIPMDGDNYDRFVEALLAELCNRCEYVYILSATLVQDFIHVRGRAEFVLLDPSDYGGRYLTGLAKEAIEKGELVFESCEHFQHQADLCSFEYYKQGEVA